MARKEVTSKNWFKQRNNKRWYLIIPFWITNAFLVILPLSFIVFYAFKSNPNANWALIINPDSKYTISIFNVLMRSLGWSLLATLIVILLAYPYAYFIARMKNPTYRFLALAFITFPIYMNSLVRLIGLKTMLDFMITDNTNQMRNIIAIIYSTLPLMVLPLYNSLSTLNKYTIDASKDLGNNSIKTFFKVTVPSSLGGLFSGIALVFLTSVTSVAIPSFMTPNVNWIGNIIYNTFDPSNLHTSNDLSLGALITVVTASFTLTLYMIMKTIPRFFGKNNNVRMKSFRK